MKSFKRSKIFSRNKQYFSGSATCGSTTTTHLLAYSGSYIARLLDFMAQGSPIELILNYKYVTFEIAHTIVGSIGLITVVSLTAITSNIFHTQNF